MIQKNLADGNYRRQAGPWLKYTARKHANIQFPDCGLFMQFLEWGFVKTGFAYWAVTYTGFVNTQRVQRRQPVRPGWRRKTSVR